MGGTDMYLYKRLQTLQTITTPPQGEQYMNLFIAAVKAGKQPSPATMDFFAKAFEEILAGGITEKRALKLTKPRSGNRAITHFGENLIAAVMVEERRPEYDSYEDTYLGLEEETGINESTLQRWHEKHKETAKAILKNLQEEQKQ